MVMRCDRDGPVGDDRVKVMARKRVVEDRVMSALRHQDRPVGMFGGKGAEGAGQRLGTFDMGQLQVGQFRPAEPQVQVAFDKARQKRRAVTVDDLGGAR